MHLLPLLLSIKHWAITRVPVVLRSSSLFKGLSSLAVYSLDSSFFFHLLSAEFLLERFLLHGFEFVQFSFGMSDFLFKSFLGLVLGLVDDDWVLLRLGIKVSHLLLGWIGSCPLESLLLESSHFPAAVLSGASFDQDESQENGADDHAPFEEMVELCVVAVIFLFIGFLIILFERSVVPHFL